MKWEAPFGGLADAIGVVLGPVRKGLVSASACSAGDCGVRSPGSKPKRFPFHPGAAGQEKTGGKRARFPAPGRHPAVLG